MPRNHELYGGDAAEFISQQAAETTTDTDVSSERQIIIKPEYSKPKTIMYTALGVVGLTLVGFVASGFISGNDYFAALKPRITADGSVLKPGEATVKKIDMQMPPITLATADTDASVKVGFKENFSALNGAISVDFNQSSVTRKDALATSLRINPDHVEIDYNVMTGKMKFIVPDGALSTKVDIPVGGAKTVDTSGSITALPLDMETALANAISGQLGMNASDVPILGQLAKGTTSIKGGLENFADLYLATQVDEKCTPLIPQKVPGFTKLLKDNIRTVVKAELLNPSVVNSKQINSLSALMNMPLAKVQKIAESATVEMSDNYTFTPDQANIALMKKYTDSKFFTKPSLKNDIVCGVSKDVKLTVADSGASK